MNTKAEKNKAALRLILAVAGLVFLVFAAVNFIPDVLMLLKNGDSRAIMAYVRGMGRYGVFIIVILQILQTLTIVFPGIPIYMCAGIVFGRTFGTIVCYLTYVVTNVIIFVFSRRVGEAADVLLENSDDKGVGKLLKKAKHPMRVVALLCVVPLIPNGIIPHIAAQSDLSLKQFTIAVSVGCIPGIFLFVCCGDLLMSGYMGAVAGVCVVAILLMVITYIFKDKFTAMTEKLLEKQ